MPISPESQPEHPRLPPNPEVHIQLNGVSPVDWFGYMIGQINEYFDINPDLDNTERQQIIAELGTKLHTVHEAWHYLALYANVNNDVNSEYMGPAREDLGIIRQTLIRYGIRPQLNEEFVYRTDLTSDGQRLFSLLQENPLKLSDLQALARDKINGFDLAVAIIELRTWGFLDENNLDYLGLADHPDLRGF